MHLKISICVTVNLFPRTGCCLAIQDCKSVGLTWNCQNIQCHCKHVCTTDTEQYHSVVVCIFLALANPFHKRSMTCLVL